MTSSSRAQEDLKCYDQKLDFQNLQACVEREEKSYLGKYLCLIDHVGGIEYDNDYGKGDPYVGRIKPTEDRFFMEISEDSSISCSVIHQAPDDSCKIKYKMTYKSKNIFLREDGYSALIPATFHTSGGVMMIVAGGRFNGDYKYGWNSYVFDGRCEKIN